MATVPFNRAFSNVSLLDEIIAFSAVASSLPSTSNTNLAF